MNHFDNLEAAKRYAKSRPYYHELIMKQLRRFLQFKHKLPMGLDLACGTGLSSKALCEVAEKVFACDSSAFMIEQTIPNEAIIYFVSEGKNLDFPNESFDIITVASALHWMDTNSVFNEVSRVLKPKAWLLVYDHHIKLNQSNLNDWYETYFKQHFPAPPRNSINIQSILPENLCLIKEEKGEHQITFTLLDFVQFLCTQSNVSNSVNLGKKNYESIENQLKNELLLYFKDEVNPLQIDFSYQYQLIRKI